MQRAFGMVVPNAVENGATGKAATWKGRPRVERTISEPKSNPVAWLNASFCGILDSSRVGGIRSGRPLALFRRGECFVQPRLATIGGVPMNDPVLSRFVDSRNRGANLIGGAIWR